MQTLTEIRAILQQAGLRPARRFGQNFLIDKNLMQQVLDLSELAGDEVVLEVGPGTGSLTEELLGIASRVVAVEIDRGLAEALRQRLGENDRFTLLQCDVLASKHAVDPRVHAALGPRAVMVANLPYNIATPLVAQCLVDSWRASLGPAGEATRFDRLTFTVQKEVAERIAAAPGSSAYGPISILASLLGGARLGAVLPATAFWPRPEVASQVVRVDFDAAAAATIANIDALQGIISLAFAQRRKQIGSIFRRAPSSCNAPALGKALDTAGVDPHSRAEQIPPEAFAAIAAAMEA